MSVIINGFSDTHICSRQCPRSTSKKAMGTEELLCVVRLKRGSRLEEEPPLSLLLPARCLNWGQAGHWEVDNLQRQGRPVLQNPCFTEKFVSYFGSAAEDDAPAMQETPGWLQAPADPDWPAVLKATCSALPVYSGNIYSSPISDGVED